MAYGLRVFLYLSSHADKVSYRYMKYVARHFISSNHIALNGR